MRYPAISEHGKFMHQKVQKFQRRLFYAHVSSDDNVLIENSKDSVTNSDSNTNIKIVNLTFFGLLAASQRSHNYHLRLIQHTKLHAYPAVFLRLALHIEGIGNQDKRPGTMQMNRTCTFQSLTLF
jgi:hypothetical protein